MTPVPCYIPFSRTTGAFIIKENADTGLKNVCCGDSWQITVHGTQFYNPRYHWLKDKQLINLFLSLYMCTQVTMFKQAESWFKPHNDISFKLSCLRSKKKIVLYSNMTEFSSHFGQWCKEDKTNLPIPRKMAVTLAVCSTARTQLRKKCVFIYVYASWAHIKASWDFKDASSECCRG